MWQGMKSVTVFDPKDSQEETNLKWMEWNQHKSAVGNKYVPTAQETRNYLAVQENKGRRYS